jgi:hypothetical protein
MDTCLGWPMVTAENCFDVVRDLGIKPWEQVGFTMTLNDYLRSASPGRIEEYDRFGPKNSVGRYLDPHRNEYFTGFRTTFKPYVIVFGLLPGNRVPVTVEWKHGNGKITFVPPAGVPGKEEEGITDLFDKMEATALREWREETGTTLRSVTPLGPRQGIYSEVRKAESRYFPFLGNLNEDIPKSSQLLDKNEHLQMVVFPLDEWVTLIDSPHLWDENPDFGQEFTLRDVTYAALRKLGRLKIS